MDIGVLCSLQDNLNIVSWVWTESWSRPESTHGLWLLCVSWTFITNLTWRKAIKGHLPLFPWSSLQPTMYYRQQGYISLLIWFCRIKTRRRIIPTKLLVLLRIPWFSVISYSIVRDALTNKARWDIEKNISETLEDVAQNNSGWSK